jgi:hypothetical protein
MKSIRYLLLAAILQTATVTAADSTIEFYFTNDEFLQQTDSVATLKQWNERCIMGGEFAEFAASYAPDPQMGIAEREAQAAKFDRSKAVQLATDAWRAANAALPQGPMRVCIDLARPVDEFTRTIMGGVSGVTAGRGRIILRVHPDADWQAALPYALAHEMHHSYWVHHHFNANAPFTLADYLVLEGRADYFAGTLFNYRAPWTAALDASSYTTTWRAISTDLSSTDWQKLQGAMFGSRQLGIPNWAGYSIGFRLVSERMTKTPKLDLRTMTAAPASEFMPATD